MYNMGPVLVLVLLFFLVWFWFWFCWLPESSVLGCLVCLTHHVHLFLSLTFTS